MADVTNKQHHPAYTHDEVAACAEAFEKGDLDFVKNMVESKGLKYFGPDEKLQKTRCQQPQK